MTWNVVLSVYSTCGGPRQSTLEMYNMKNKKYFQDNFVTRVFCWQYFHVADKGNQNGEYFKRLHFFTT